MTLDQTIAEVLELDKIASDKPDWGTVRAICRRAFDSETIALSRKLKQYVELESSRAQRGTHRAIDQMGEMAMEEWKKGNTELAEKIKAILEPTGLYQWIGNST